jgi:hypothetical protein
MKSDNLPASELHALLCELFPVRVGYRELALVPAPEGTVAERPDGALHATFRLIAWEPGPWGESGAHAAHAILDLKEQELMVIPSAARSRRTRVHRFLRGWTSALREVLDGTAQLAPILPHELHHPQVLTLQRAESEHDFVRALLQPSRLGRLVPGMMPRPGLGRRHRPGLLEGPVTLAWAERILSDLLPLQEKAQQLAAPTTGALVREDSKGLWACLQRIDSRQTRPAEWLLLVPAAALADARRVRAYLCGWSQAVHLILKGQAWRSTHGQLTAYHWNVDPVSAADLVAPDTLGDTRLRYPEEFSAALLNGPFARLQRSAPTPPPV